MSSSASASPAPLIDFVERQPAGAIALIAPDRGIRVAYGSLSTQVRAVAEQLAAAGISRGHRVAIALPNGVPMVVTFLAASLAGTAAPLNPSYKEDEFRFFLGDTGARVLILPPDGAEEARRAAGADIRVLTVTQDVNGTVRLEGVPERKPVANPVVDDVALVLHTSGSTGRPKRVPLTHGNLSISAGNVARTYGLGPADVSLCVMPLFHVHGLVASTLATFATGGTVVPARFSASGFWPLVHRHGVTWYSAVPTMHQLVLGSQSSPGSQGSKLRFIRSCSAALPQSVMQQLEEAVGVPVLEAYGMTEAAHQMASNPPPPGQRKPGSVGPGTDVRISIMNDAGKHVAQGIQGEVVIQGPNVTRGYENNPEANAQSFVDGWFRTGDRGFLDDDGYLTLVARIKELINRGGEKISPREIDEVLLSHPSVAEAVAFGVPHPTYGEEVEAAIVLRSHVSEAELLAYCATKLASFKTPKRLHIVDTIPRTATGKIQRGAVAKAYSQR